MLFRRSIETDREMQPEPTFRVSPMSGGSHKTMLALRAEGG